MYNIRKTITGKNLIDVPSSYSVTTQDDIYLSLKPNTYTLSFSNSTTETSSTSFLIQILLEDNTNQSQYIYFADKKGTFTLTQNASKIRIYSGGGYNPSLNKKTTFTNLMLEIGNITAPVYEPYENPNITIEDGTNTSLVGCNIEGNSYQETYQGKNLFDASKITDGTIVVNNNGKDIIMPVKTSGNGYNPVASKLSIVCPTLQAGDVVYLHMDRSPYDTMKIAYLNGSSSVWNNHASHTITQAELDGVFTLYANNYTNGETEQVTISNLIISKTNITSSNDWEPYVGGKASPNPDNPQEVEVVETYNLLSTPFTQYNNNTLQSEISNFKAGTYTLSFDMETPAGNQVTARKIVSGTATQITYKYNAKDLTFTLDEDATLQLEIYKTGVLLSDISKVMLNKGNIIENYIPYNNIGVNVQNKNLLNFADGSGGVTNYYYTNVPLNYTIPSNLENKKISLSFDITLTNYSGTSTGMYASLGCGDAGFTTVMKQVNYPSVGNITYKMKLENISISSDIIGKNLYIRFAGFSSPSTINYSYSNMQLEIGETASNYVSYSNITTPIDLQGNFIGKIETIKDELNIDDLGNVILTKRIGKVVLDGSDSDIQTISSYSQVSSYTSGTSYQATFSQLLTKETSTEIVVKSNYFNAGILTDRNTKTNIVYSYSDGQLRIANDIAITKSEFLSWLSTHNTEVYYVLETPYTINLGKANIELNNGTNYITFLTGLDTRNTIEYGADTTAFREQSYSGESLYKADLRIYHNEEENIIDMEQIARITIKDPIIDTTSSVFYLGSFIAKSITIKFKNLDGIDITSGDKVTLQIAQTINNEDIYIPIGEFYVDDLAENYQKTCEIVCNDASVKFKQAVDYSSCFVESQNEDEPPTATIDAILHEICDICEVPLGKYPTINGDLVVGIYDGSISGKQWISYIAELKGCNAKIDRFGRLTLIPLKQRSNVTINALESKNWNLGEKYTISQVRYYNGSLWYESPVDPENDENVLYIRNDNPFIDSNELLDNIYDLVADCEIYNVKTQNYGDITLDAYDNITYNLDENSYQTLNDNTIIYEMSLMTTVENKISTKQQEKTTNVILGDQNTQMKMIKTTVDLANAKITTTAREVNDINVKFNDYVTTGTYSNLENRVTTVETTTYTKTEVSQILKGEYVDEEGNKVQVTKAVTESGAFSNEGLRIQKEDENGNVISQTSGLFNELGVDIKRTSDNQNVLYAGMVDESDTRFSGYEGQTIVGTENVIIKTYLVMGDKSRFEDYEYATGKHATGCYWIGD